MKNTKFKTTLAIFLIVVIGGAAVAYFMWNKPRRDVTDEKGVEVTASQLVKEYQANETQANTQYLDKAIQVSGQVIDVKTNQEGKVTVMLASDDAMTGVFCTLKEKEPLPVAGSSIVIKGICSGMLSDVRLREAVIVK